MDRHRTGGGLLALLGLVLTLACDGESESGSVDTSDDDAPAAGVDDDSEVPAAGADDDGVEDGVGGAEGGKLRGTPTSSGAGQGGEKSAMQDDGTVGGATPTPDAPVGGGTTLEPSVEPEPGPANATGTSEAEACVAYAEASCARTLECNAVSPEEIATVCPTVAAGCPDLVFSDGATRTVESLLQCAEVVATYDCVEWNSNRLPDCVTPGTREPGETCIFPSQCRTLECSGTSDQCGMCLAFATDADDCRDGTQFACGPGTYCEEDTGSCVDIRPEQVTPDEPLGDPTADMRGTPCMLDADCGYYESCMQDLERLDDPEAFICNRDPIRGEDCDDARSCEDRTESYCELDGLTCLAIPKEGEACGVDGWTGSAVWCERGTICERSAERVGICVALPEQGAPCFWQQFPEGDRGYCAIGLVCSEALVCEPEPDPVLEPVPVAIGGSCVDSNAQCHPASECIDGICQPNDLHGWFDGACRPVE